MAKAVQVNNSIPGLEQWLVFCPACQQAHVFTTQAPPALGHDVWTFNGDAERPTFSPSMLTMGPRGETRCHSFVTDGRIQFCTDSPHAMSGQTVDLPDVPGTFCGVKHVG